jgi:GrpB-like predicted nucleotidyltransferase (UPF0157 family)
MQRLSTAQKKKIVQGMLVHLWEKEVGWSARFRTQLRKLVRHRALSTAHARSRKRMNKEEVDIFDAILEHLVAEGYADTNESALVIMANMSEEWRQSIVEVKLDPRGRPASGPMNVYANPKGKPDQAHLDAVKLKIVLRWNKLIQKVLQSFFRGM